MGFCCCAIVIVPPLFGSSAIAEVANKAAVAAVVTMVLISLLTVHYSLSFSYYENSRSGQKLQTVVLLRDNPQVFAVLYYYCRRTTICSKVPFVLSSVQSLMKLRTTLGCRIPA